MKKFRTVLCILLALVMVLALAACGSKTAPSEDGRKPAPGTNQPTGTTNTPSTGNNTETPSTGTNTTPVSTDPERGKTIRVGENELGRFLAGIAPSEDHSACDLLWDSTFKIDPITKQPYSDIFEDWYWEDDHVFVEKLYPNIYFSSGNHATAEDVLFSYTSHEERGSNYMNNSYVNWDKTEIRDDYTLAFYVDQKSEFLERRNMYLLDKKWAESLPDGWADLAWYQPSSSGPYECTEYVHGDYLVLEKRDSYWKRDINDYYVDKFIFKAYSDQSTMYMDLELGNLDLCEVSSADYSRFLKSGNEGRPFNCILIPSGTVYYINYAWLDNPIWKDENVRMAFAHGIDLESLGILMNNDCYMPANSLIPDTAPYYVDVGHYEYDPDLAKEYLAKAGYGPGDLHLKMTLMDTQVYKSFGQGIAYYLGEMGVDIDIDYADISASIANWIVPGNNDLGMMYSISGSDSQRIQDSIQQAGDRGGVAWTFVDDDHFQELYDTIRFNWDDPATVEKAAKELQQYNFDHAMILPIACCTGNMGYNTDVFTEQQVRDYLFSAKPWRLNELSLKGFD